VGGVSAIHSPTASREVAPASTAHAVSASTMVSACRTPRGSGTLASRCSKPGTSQGDTSRCSLSWSGQAGSAMMRRLARSRQVTGRRELHDLGSPCLSRSEGPTEADRQKPDAASSCKVHSLSAAQEQEIRVELAGDYVPTSVISPFSLQPPVVPLACHFRW
jgi:hypothetical protein